MKKLKYLYEVVTGIFRGNVYTEKEVRKLFSGVQYEIAQEIIGNRSEAIIPLEYFDANKK